MIDSLIITGIVCIVIFFIKYKRVKEDIKREEYISATCGRNDYRTILLTSERIHSLFNSKLIDNIYFNIKNQTSQTIIQKFQNALDISYMSGTPELPQTWVYNVYANTIGDNLESGKYHVGIGILNEEGNELVRCFEWLMLESCKAGVVTQKYAEENIKTLKNNIAYLSNC